ncbi:hypothetical protein [Desmospora profundinema]|uniref:Uncharacterized protein n=1 Tax=Desmospora profundinema TaxID=1571184 RepID=A0ABU1ITM7_9BACL|nr:hypothetical protein [Desmospora profundinema]MDR6227544.1 hypothetical protein [Desmospora profundinema]
MGKEREITYFLFDLIVGHMERIPEGQRMIQRIEVNGEGLDFTLREGGHYRMEVKKQPENEIAAAKDGEGAALRGSKYGAEEERVTIPLEDWEKLVQACESLLELLEYDQRKMDDLRQAFPQFPWEERKQMMDGMTEQLRSTLERILSVTEEDPS